MTGWRGCRTLPGRPTGQVAGAQRIGFEVWRSNARQIAPAPDAGTWSDGPAVRFGLREQKILILVRFQDETNDPGPSGQTSQRLGICRHPREASFKLTDD